jgi:hypothetical protein
VSEIQLLIAAAALICIYHFLRARIAVLLQPLRLELAETGETLIADETIPADYRDSIELILHLAYSAGAAWMLVAAYPYVSLKMLRRSQDRNDPLAGLSAEKRRALSFVIRVGTISIFANSPLAAFIFMLEILLFRPIGRTMRQAIKLIDSSKHSRWHWSHGGT